MWASFIISLSIFFESDGRKEEVTYFVLVRALTSIYELMKRRKWISIPKEEHTAFILIFGIISFIYHEHKNFLKHTNIYEALWGES